MHYITILFLLLPLRIHKLSESFLAGDGIATIHLSAPVAPSSENRNRKRFSLGRVSSCCKACCFRSIEASAAKDALSAAAATLAQDTELLLEDREQALDLVLDIENVREPLLLTESSG